MRKLGLVTRHISTFRFKVDLAYYLLECIRRWVVPEGSALKFHLRKEVLAFYQDNVVKITEELGLKSVGI